MVKSGTFWSFSSARSEGDDRKGEISGWADENQVTVEDSGLCDILAVESQGLAMVRAAADRAAKVYKEQAKREQTKKEQINKECDKRAKRHADQKETANTQQEEWTKFIKSVQPSKYFEDEIIDEHGRLAINYFGSFRSE